MTRFSANLILAHVVMLMMLMWLASAMLENDMGLMPYITLAVALLPMAEVVRLLRSAQS